MDEPEKIVTQEDDLANLVMAEWDKATEYVSELDDLYEDLYAMLRGERPDKNYDWQSNIVINKVFQVIWTTVPYIVQKIFGGNPIIGVKSFDKKGAWQRETILEFWYTMQSPKCEPFFLITVMMALRGLLNGVSVMKKTWHQKLKREKIEQQVAVPMKMDEAGNEIDVEPYMQTRTVSVPVEDWPNNEVINNKDLRWDWELTPGKSITKGRFITNRSVHDMEYLKSTGLYENLDKVLTCGSTETEEEHSDLTGKDGQEFKPESVFYEDVEIYERQGLLNATKGDDGWVYDPDGKSKEMVVTLARAAKANGESRYTIIRFEPNPYGEKCYVDLHVYLDPERWQSMGMIEPFKDIQTALNDNINAMFDEIWQNLMPPVVVDKNALWDWDTMIYAPGQRWIQGGNPNTAAMWKQPSNITGDAWQKHVLLDSEIQLTSAVTPPMQGAGKEKAATTNVLNAQMSAGKLDFVIKMIEVTFLVPNAQMDVRFAEKFAHKLTFKRIVGEPFSFTGYEEIYKYTPAASTVKLEHERDREIQNDIQLIQVLANINNPKTAKVINVLWQNILRNRNMPAEAALFDEEYFEPGTDAGQLQQLEDKLSGANSNQNGVPMSGSEQSVREGTYSQKGLSNY